MLALSTRWRSCERVALTAVLGLVFAIRPIVSFAQVPEATCCTVTSPAKPFAPKGLFTEPRTLTSLGDVIANHSLVRGKPDGLYPRFGGMLPGGGWMAIGPGYRRHVLGGQVFVDVSAAVSWRTYRIAQLRVESRNLADHFTVGTQVLWQDVTQSNFFGLGRAARPADGSEYRLQGADVTAYVIVRASNTVSIEARGGQLGRPTISHAIGWNDKGYRDTRIVYDEVSAPGITARPRFLHGDVAVTASTLNHPGHPTRGGLYQAAVSAYHDRDLGQYSFRNYEFTAAQFVPLVYGKWTLAARGSLEISSTSNGNRVPIYMLPSLGGHNALRGYLDYQFQDRNAAALSIESRLAVFAHLDAAIFVDAGDVAANVRSLGLSKIGRSYGAGVRFHSGLGTIMRFDVGRSAQGWRLLFKLGDPFVFLHDRGASLLPVLPAR